MSGIRRKNISKYANSQNKVTDADLFSNHPSHRRFEELSKKPPKKVLIHLDLDVLDPNDLYVAVGKEPNGMKLKEVVEDINLIGKNFDIVGLTIAERMPIESMRLQFMMNNLPLFK